MNAKSEHLLEKISRLDTSGQQHYPSSRKVYVEGSRADLKVPMREISLTATQTEAGMKRIHLSGSMTRRASTLIMTPRLICARGFLRYGSRGSRSDRILNCLRARVPPMAKRVSRM